MLNNIQDEIRRLIPAFEQKKYLLAVSGGMDSMALAHIFKELKLSYSIAHFNFQLRGDESDGDETWVRETARKLNVLCFVSTTDTKKYCADNNYSIQEGARNLRYKWFDQLLQEEGFDFVVTAHHLNDHVETFFLNLLRGSGINGLKGIPQRNNQIIRPLLNTSKSEIEQFVSEHQIGYREDSSNQDDKYQRNYIRHHILPKLTELNEHAVDSISRSMYLLAEANDFIKKQVDKESLSIKSVIDDQTIIDLRTKPSNFLLYQILRDYGFNESQVNDILESKQSGRLYYSSQYCLNVDRDQLIIKEQKIENDVCYSLNPGVIEHPFTIRISEETVPEKIDKNANIALFDADEVRFPFELRKWREGDYFIPLGMKGKKKLSDFFTDNKLSLFAKNEIWVLCSEGKIIWVVNHRIDDRVKITKKTKKVIRFETDFQK